MSIEHFFAVARERHRIWLRRQSGTPWPWTNDPIFRSWRFCNVFRENDTTTEWFRKKVREPLNGDPLRLVEATIAFRWFNRIETGERVLELLLNGWDGKEAYQKLRRTKPVVTGSFMVKSPTGRSKLRGLLWCIDKAHQQLPSLIGKWDSLETSWKSLKDLPYLGGFNAYEIVLDLAQTPILQDAPDRVTWAFAGPGAARGLSRLTGVPYRNSTIYDQRRMVGFMMQVASYTADVRYWPAEWPTWTIHEAERFACEYEKYCRVREGGKLKRRYRANVGSAKLIA